MKKTYPKDDSTLVVLLTNVIDIKALGYSYKDIILTTDNGEIKYQQQINNDFYYYIIPERTGIVNLQLNIKTTKGTKHIDEKQYKARCLEYVFKVAGKRSGDSISTKDFHVQIAPVATIVNTGGRYDGNYKITKFTFIVIRNGKEIINKVMQREEGVRFKDDKDVDNAVWTIKPNDKVILQDIVLKGPGVGCEKHIKHYELTITK